MGIFVRSGVLPNGIPVSNVYMCFSEFCLRIVPISNKSGWFCINTSYCVYADPTKRKGTDIRFEIFIETNDPNRPIYDIAYDYLKSLYPDSENML